MKSIFQAGDSEWTAALTMRERDVMSLMVQGRANKIIAGELGISIRTVEVHRARVMSKLGVRNVVELVVAMHRHRASMAFDPLPRFVLNDSACEPTVGAPERPQAPSGERTEMRARHRLSH